jgi:DNA-binding NarL/FixJ family response regulator
VIRVLLADDQALLRAGFRLILDLELDLEVVAEAADGHEAVRLTRELQPDVVLMDIQMPGIDGLEATRLLAADSTTARILILTTFDLDEYVYDAMKAGASGFLLKDAGREQLVAAVHTVAAGEALLAPSITRRLIEDHVRRPRPGQRTPPEMETLSDREIEVLRLVTRGRSNAEIATELFVTGATIKTHVAHIMQKLQIRDRIQAVVLGYESGLVQPGED